jgi:predicted RNase H-like HicB family nuclease
MALTYRVVLTREEDGRYSVSVPALKGCHTWGYNLPHALRMAEEAILGYLESLELDGEAPPADSHQVAFDMGEAPEAYVYRLTVGEATVVA